MSNIFNTTDVLWHGKYVKPVRGLWTMTKVLDVEPLIDETLKEFGEKLSTNFADVSNTCMVDNWLAYCMSYGIFGDCFLLTSAFTQLLGM